MLTPELLRVHTLSAPWAPKSPPSSAHRRSEAQPTGHCGYLWAVSPPGPCSTPPPPRRTHCDPKPSIPPGGCFAFPGASVLRRLGRREEEEPVPWAVLQFLLLKH